MVAGDFVKRPCSGWVESVSTFADHLFFVAIAAPEESLLCIHRMRIDSLLSPACQEKIAEHAAAFVGENSGLHFGPVIESRMIEYFENAAAGSGLGVVGGVDKPDDACVQDGAGAHRAGFEGDVQRAASLRREQAVVRESTSCLAHRNDFGVGGGIAVAKDAILATAKHGLTIRTDDDGADGNLSCGFSGTRLGHGEAHDALVKVGGDFRIVYHAS
jgi:hypothetical protein